MKKFLFLFLLMPTLAFGLAVNTPTAQEVIPTGSTFSIQWTATTASNFNLYASYNNGLTWGKALNSATKVAATSFDWSVPLLTNNMTKCKIKVIGYNDAGKMVETGISPVFTINVLDVLHPNGPADDLSAGQITTVTWATLTPANVTDTKLSYSINNGLTWITISTISGNPGAFAWTVPQIATKSAKLRVDLINGSKIVATGTSAAAFNIGLTPKTKADANGIYYETNMGYNYATTPAFYTGVHELNFDGTSGKMDFSTLYWSLAAVSPPSAANVPYTISGNGQTTINNRLGIISDDGNLILLADPDRFKEKELDFGMAIKPTSGLSEAVLNGTYVLGQVGYGWVGLFTVTMDGAGNGNVHCESMSLTGGCNFTDIPFTYTVDGTTGQISDTLGHRGMVSADGNLFTNVDYGADDSLLSISVGIKKSTSGLSDETLAGKFLCATFGLADPHGPYVDIFQANMSGQGKGTSTELYTSWPPLTRPHAFSYTVTEDGTLSVDSNGTELQGIAMGNGQGFLIFNNTADDSSISIGLKTTK